MKGKTMRYKLCIAFMPRINPGDGTARFFPMGIHPNENTLKSSLGDELIYIETVTSLENLDQIASYAAIMLEIEGETMQ